MFVKKQIYFLVAMAAILSLALAQQQVFAQWTGPGSGPGGAGASPPLTNPMSEDFDLYGWNISNSSGTDSGIDVDTINATSGTFTGNLDVTTIDNHTVAEFLAGGGGGGISNPLEEDISGQTKFGIKQLISCIPGGEGQVCGALEAVANKNAINKAYSVGVYGQTTAGSVENPSYGVYGLANNSGGTGVLGYALTGRGIGIRGSSASGSGYGGYFDNSAGGIALGVNGDIEFGNATLIQTSGSASTDYVGSEKVAIENAHLTVDGQINAGDGFFTGQHSELYSLTITGATSLEGPVVMEGGLAMEGLLRVDARAGHFGHLSAIVGIATSTDGFESNAGVEGIGTIGVYGNGHLVGVFGASPGYGGIFKGATATGWNPPGGGTGGGEIPPDHAGMSLLGINKTLASVDTAASVGMVAAGGWLYSGGFGAAGLGICALSGEMSYEVDGGAGDGDFFAYCQDPGGVNNYAGFFAGNIYVKEGSIQLSDVLDTDSENLIYGNVRAASADASLLRLQMNSVDKFRVDRDGNLTADNFYVDAENGRVGVGTTGPTDLFVVNGNARVTGTLKLASGTLGYTSLAHRGDENTGMYFPAVDNIALVTNSQARVTVNASGVTLGNPKILSFNGGGTSGPDCKSGSEGIMYYFSRYDVLCVCDGSGWQSLMNSVTNNSYCTNNVYTPH